VIGSRPLTPNEEANEDQNPTAIRSPDGFVRGHEADRPGDGPVNSAHQFSGARATFRGSTPKALTTSYEDLLRRLFPSSLRRFAFGQTPTFSSWSFAARPPSCRRAFPRVLLRVLLFGQQHVTVERSGITRRGAARTPSVVTSAGMLLAAGSPTIPTHFVPPVETTAEHFQLGDAWQTRRTVPQELHEAVGGRRPTFRSNTVEPKKRRGADIGQMYITSCTTG